MINLEHHFSEMKKNLPAVHHVSLKYSTPNHHPFGMVIKGRSNSYDYYRFGFNGVEEDNELVGESITLNYGARIYDSRLARWFSIDPDYFDNPYASSYCFSLNSPIFLTDPNGKTVVIWDKNGNVAAIATKDGLQIAEGFTAESPAIKNYQIAKTHIEQGNNSTVFTESERREQVIHLVPLSSINLPDEVKTMGPHFKPISENEGIIAWSATLALESANGTINSPAGVLTHELHHAHNYFDDPEATEKRRTTEKRTWGPKDGDLKIEQDYKKQGKTNAEEADVMDKTNETLKGVPGEGSTREKHSGGKLFRTTGPTGTYNLDPKSVKKDNTGRGSSYGNRGY